LQIKTTDAIAGEKQAKEKPFRFQKGFSFGFKT